MFFNITQLIIGIDAFHGFTASKAYRPLISTFAYPSMCATKFGYSLTTV